MDGGFNNAVEKAINIYIIRRVAEEQMLDNDNSITQYVKIYTQSSLKGNEH